MHSKPEDKQDTPPPVPGRGQRIANRTDMSVSTPAGRINKLFGTDGGVMLSLYADFPADFDTDTPLMVTIDALEVPLYCERFERRGATGAVAAFADFDTERRAQELLGREFRIEFEEEEDDEFYLEDLIGFAVSCIEAGADGAHGVAAPLAGTVTDYYDSDANPLFELELAGRTVLVPAAEEFIAHIDFEGRTIKMVLPEGLLDL